MTSRDRWVRWTPVKRGKLWTKMPLTISGQAASSTDPSTWSTFKEAQKSPAGVGMGFVLGEGIGCLDLDHCLENGVVADWARDFMAEIADPIVFTEISQSGTGIHIFIEAHEATGSKIRDGRNIERYTAGRYIAVTGHPLTVK